MEIVKRSFFPGLHGLEGMSPLATPLSPFSPISDRSFYSATSYSNRQKLETGLSFSEKTRQTLVIAVVIYSIFTTG